MDLSAVQSSMVLAPEQAPVLVRVRARARARVRARVKG